VTRQIPETYRNQDWPRLVAQTVNELARVNNKAKGGLRFDGGSATVDGFFQMDGGSA